VAVEEGWQRQPFVHLDLDTIQTLLGTRVVEAEPLSGGARNSNYRVRLADEAKPVVLRLYTSRGGRGFDSAEDTPCARELALNQLVRDSVPMPRVLRADPTADPPWALIEFVDGSRFDQALTQMSDAEVERASRDAGAVLARIHAFAFDEPGLFGPNLQIAQSFRGNWLGMVEHSMSTDHVRKRATPELADRILRLIEQHAWRMEPFWSQAQLIHCDYKPWNMLVRNGTISAVLDWEFASSGPPLYDLAIYLRYRERHPAVYTTALFDGYRDAGGSVPDDALRLTRLIDLVSVCSFLVRREDDPAITLDMRGVILATLEAFSE
jgi:aminoglycoside phosphotransferase (APT) family kinase protein